MLKNFINEKYLSEKNINILKNNYIQANPFNYLEINDFFKSDILNQVLKNFPDLRNLNSYKKENLNEKKFGLEDQSLMPNDISNFISFLNSGPFLKYIQKITNINETLISDPYLNGGGLHETKKGGFLKIHSDFYIHRHLKLDRRLNLLIYLNNDWKEEYGGQLELWDKNMKKCEKKISINFNKIFIFSTNDKSFHGYPDPINCPIEKSRKSIAMYYYSNGRLDKEDLLNLPNTTNWKSRNNLKEVENNYTFKDYLRKFKFLRKLKNYFF
tara:strand:+ start:152 stop:961 length:810 start_codon:yes stop_codon:yes gene_type:complete